MDSVDRFETEILEGRMTAREAMMVVTVRTWCADGWSEELQDAILPHMIRMWDRTQGELLERVIGKEEPHFSGILNQQGNPIERQEI